MKEPKFLPGTRIKAPFYGIEDGVIEDSTNDGGVHYYIISTISKVAGETFEEFVPEHMILDFYKPIEIWTLDCPYYNGEFYTLDELLDDVVSSGMDPSYKIMKNRVNTGDRVIDLIQF